MVYDSFMIVRFFISWQEGTALNADKCGCQNCNVLFLSVYASQCGYTGTSVGGSNSGVTMGGQGGGAIAPTYEIFAPPNIYIIYA